MSVVFFFSTVVTSGNSVLSEQNISYLLLQEYWCFWNWIWQKLFVNIKESVKYGVLWGYYAWMEPREAVGSWELPWEKEPQLTGQAGVCSVKGFFFSVIMSALPSPPDLHFSANTELWAALRWGLWLERENVCSGSYQRTSVQEQKIWFLRWLFLWLVVA